MKLLRYNCSTQPVTTARLGLLLPGDLVGDMRAGYARYLVEKKGDGQGREVAALRMQPHIAAFLAIGSPGWDAAMLTQDYLTALSRADRSAAGLEGEPLFTPLTECRLHATVRPSKVIAVGRKYAEHLKEAGVKIDSKVPSAWIKANNAIIGPTRYIVKPRLLKPAPWAICSKIVTRRSWCEPSSRCIMASRRSTPRSRACSCRK